MAKQKSLSLIIIPLITLRFADCVLSLMFRYEGGPKIEVFPAQLMKDASYPVATGS